jgi:hypothetical protein
MGSVPLALVLGSLSSQLECPRVTERPRSHVQWCRCIQTTTILQVGPSQRQEDLPVCSLSRPCSAAAGRVADWQCEAVRCMRQCADQAASLMHTSPAALPPAPCGHNLPWHRSGLGPRRAQHAAGSRSRWDLPRPSQCRASRPPGFAPRNSRRQALRGGAESARTRLEQ